MNQQFERLGALTALSELSSAENSIALDICYRFEQSKYGFQYFDKPLTDQEEDLEEDDDEGYEMHACPPDCCDKDCECDDCARCSEADLTESDSYDVIPAAAA